MKLIIFGASGTGKTTFGRSLSKKLNWNFLDSDEYYWEKTIPPYEKKIPLEIRNENLKTDFEKCEDVIVCGSLCTWSKFWDTAFELGIFLWIPKKLRMERLSKREINRYGTQFNKDLDMRRKSRDFLEWAEKYDDATHEGASITQHLNWIKELSCSVIELKGDFTNEKRINLTLEKIKDYQQSISDQTH